jgi:hypothetical protein
MSRQRPISDITHAIVHCSASPNGRHVTARDIDEWHGPGRARQGLRPFLRNPEIVARYSPSLRHIGYHIVNRVDGRVEYGRSFSETGAHCPQQRMNYVSVGICLVGFDQFSPTQWANLRSQVLALQHQFPGIIIEGHRAFNPLKICPGFDVPTWLERGMTPNSENIYRPEYDQLATQREESDIETA